MRLWLDDVRPPWKWGRLGWEWVKTGEAAIALLQTGRVTEASLDHDLAWEHYPQNGLPESAKSKSMTGYDVTKWLEANPQYWPQDGVTVHSLNPVGRERMQMVIDRHYERRDFTKKDSGPQI